MPSLTSVLADPSRRRRVIEGGAALVEAEVAGKGGLSGLALKGGFAVVKKAKPDFVPAALDALMDTFAARIDPFWERCQAEGAEARSYFVTHGPSIADALLAVTDAKARSVAGPVRAVYDKLRPEARKHVLEAMPRLGDLVRTHAAA
ncbi:MAG: hypothetical protein RLZZ299_2764 [Pseudomonadota bacterium]|jgi:hypothetical protein